MASVPPATETLPVPQDTRSTPATTEPKIVAPATATTTSTDPQFVARTPRQTEPEPATVAIAPVDDAELAGDSPGKVPAKEPTSSENEPVSTALPIHPNLDEGLDWQRCGSDRPLDVRPFALQTEQQDLSTIEISADSAETATLQGTATFRGAVELQQGSQRIFADEVNYANQSGDLHARGQVLLLRSDLRLAASEVDYNLRDRHGHARDAEYRLPNIMARGTAQQAEFVDQARSNYEHITYTTCAPGNSDWLLSAERLEIDRAEGLGTAHDAKLSFLGVPLAWVPKLTFPIDDRRRSGILIPTLAYNTSHGVNITVPYYLNLAPNYDLTLSPRIMSKRGIMLGGEFRFLTSHTEGIIDADYLPNDRENPAERQRGSLSIQTSSRFDQHLSGAIRVNHVSDNDFLADFGGSLAVTSASHLERAAELRYDTNDWNALARVQKYQTIDALLPKSDRPYARLPQLGFGLFKQPQNHPLVYEIDAEFTNFAKDGGFVEGSRLDLQPTVSLPLRKAHYHLVPRASLRYTKYELDNQAAGLDSSPDRLAPIFSLDGGLYFERPTEVFGESVTHSLEPRLYYVFVPHEDHDDIPLFDTDEFDFSFDNLFRENRFNGADRLGDANQLTLAITNRFNHAATGRELLRASIGSIVYFDDREVQLDTTAPADTDQTAALVGELAADLGNGWHTRGAINWNPHENEIDQALAQASYRNQDGSIISATYRLRDSVTEHTDLGLIWPLNRNTRMIARWNYSISENRNLEALGGVEYGRCCWKVRALMRQHSTGVGDTDSLSFLLQLQLGGLGSFGDNIDSLLNDGIYGYRREDD